MLKGYRTLIFSVALAIVGALQGLDWASLLPDNPQAVGWVITVIGVTAAALRAVTTGPLGPPK